MFNQMVNGESTLEVVLTKRELEVLRLIARGMSDEAIAQKLCLSTGTVKNHLFSLYANTGLTKQGDAKRAARCQLMAIAFASGLVPESAPSIRFVEGRRGKGDNHR